MSKDKDDITRYREGSMSGAERHALEKKALNDPFLADALEGAETIREKDFTSDVDALSQKIQTGRKHWVTPLRVAAGVLLILAAGSLGYYLSPDEPVELAGLKVKELSASDSVGAEKPDSAGLIASAKDAANEKAGETKKPEATQLATTQPAATQPATISASRTQSEPAAAGPADAKALEDKAAKTEAAKVEPLATVAEEQVRADDAPKEASGAGLKRATVSERSLGLKDVVPQRIVRGTVTTEEEGSPLPGVNIAIKGTTRGTVTDLHGNYSLEVPSEPVTLSYSFIGMETKEIKPGSQLILNVRMKADAVQLSEVMVVGQSRQLDGLDDIAKPVVRLAAPVGGIRAYNHYLENGIQYTPEAIAKKVKGKVVITFTVTTTGALTDFNVVRGLGYGCEEEVVRLVKAGPDWTPSYEDDIAVESEVRVKLKFDAEKANK